MGGKMIEKKMIVFRDIKGNVINIGEWDLMLSLDYENNMVINNPLPDGATFQEEEILTLPDGGLAVKNL